MAVVKATLHKFLKHVDAKYDEALDLHVIIDNYATHTRPAVKRWPKRHPRFTLHFTPTSSSWLNLVERWFRELTHKSIRRGACASVPEITETITQTSLRFDRQHHNVPGACVSGWLTAEKGSANMRDCEGEAVSEIIDGTFLPNSGEDFARNINPA